MHVLVVDADLPNLKFVEFLRRPLHAIVTRAQSGPETLVLARHHSYDLIILDVDLPGTVG